MTDPRIHWCGCSATKPGVKHSAFDTPTCRWYRTAQPSGDRAFEFPGGVIKARHVWVVQQLADGILASEIAEALNVQPAQISVFTRHVASVLGIDNNRAHIVATLLRKGIIR